MRCAGLRAHELDTAYDHFRDVAFRAILRLIAAGLQPAFDENRTALLQVFMHKVRVLRPGDAAEKIRRGLLTPLRLAPAAVAAVDSEAESRHILARLRRAQLWVAREPAREKNFIHSCYASITADRSQPQLHRPARK